MRILIFGCGSIGRRHIKALKQIGVQDIIAYRTQKGALKDLSEEMHNVTEVYDMKVAFASAPDGVIISNPTSLHLSVLIECVKRGINVFIEKPICGSIEELVQYADFIDKLDSRIMVGYVLRFHPLFKELKKLLSQGVIGAPLKADMKVGHYLPFWHKYEDYSKGYVAQKALGGGAIRTLSHEIDLANYFFGDLCSVYSKIDKLSNLNIETDDYAFLQMQGDSGIVVNMEMNLLEPILVREGTILGEKGKISYSFTENKISAVQYDNLQEHTVFCSLSKEYDDMYVSQMREFIKLCNNHEDISGCCFKEGVKVMEIIRAAELSNESGRKVEINGYF